MAFSRNFLKKTRSYVVRTAVFSALLIIMLLVFLPIQQFKATCEAIENVWPNQSVTRTLYSWKLDYFSNGQSFQNSDTTATDAQLTKNILLPYSSYQDEIIEHTYYTVAYCEAHEQARWVAYVLSPTHLSHASNRENEHFEPDPSVSTGSALPSDYTRSGYDRGHLAPAGDFTANATMMKETFYMSNISPQVPGFNRDIWRELEEQTRRWVQEKGELYIITGPVLRDKLPRIGKKNKISVPEFYFKVILDPNTEQAVGFLMPNKASQEDFKNYAVAIDEIEQKTGLDFFEILEDSLEKKLESVVRTEGWW